MVHHIFDRCDGEAYKKSETSIYVVEHYKIILAQIQKSWTGFGEICQGQMCHSTTTSPYTSWVSS